MFLHFWHPLVNMLVIPCSPEDLHPLQDVKYRRLDSKGAHLRCDSHLIHMYPERDTQPQTHTKHWAPNPCLARSRAVMCLIQRVPSASISLLIGSIYQRHPCAYLCVCAQCATHGDITVFKQQMQRFTAATVIWCAHLWRTCLALSRHLFSPLPNALSGMRSFIFSEPRQIRGSPYSQRSPNAKYLWGLFPPLGNTTDPWQPWLFLALCVLFIVTCQ